MPKSEPSKECAGCKLFKPVSEFWTGNGKHKRRARCKPCDAEYYRSYCERNKLKLIEAVREKKCGHCQIVKPREEFTLSRNSPDHLDYLCKDCKRENGKKYKRSADTFDETLRRFHGIGRAEYETMYNAQEGRCAICGREFARISGKHPACVDHDHATGKIRELLCQRCNGALGSIEMPGFLMKALAYLKRTGSTVPPVTEEQAALSPIRPIRKAPQIYKGRQRIQPGLFYLG